MKKLLKIILWIILLLGIAFLLFEVSKSRNFQFFGGLVNKAETEDKVAAMTFDDGPGVNTDEILTILREEDVKATFYLTGKEIEQHMEDAKKIVGEGHEIGNHSYSHSRMVLKSPTFIKEEIEKTDDLIRQTGYEGEIHFRPPYGKKLFLLPYYLSKQERKTVLWNIEPESFPDIEGDADKITEYVAENIEPGSIILLHVMYESREESLKSVKKIIASLKEQGYQMTTVSDLLKHQK
ncbi:polysaccharide deacetylase family protein [Cytobacillus firmus]|uniref:polysaccharide deacetylase family protein n=1 Tax=Cytobacillus firmus TaxID=1399 RepID=UPI00202E128C|nr:polysaccharide deacetylase family protein [Cytobacillus firmus]URT68746.1 polysaccharide deacetylase family protein [Cytobacillus firmus]USK36828.1 polysaccharide deacetylase family protein [Cytobacillus firmus]